MGLNVSGQAACVYVISKLKDWSVAARAKESRLVDVLWSSAIVRCNSCTVGLVPDEGGRNDEPAGGFEVMDELSVVVHGVPEDHMRTVGHKALLVLEEGVCEGPEGFW